MPVTPRLLLAATLCFAVAMPALAQSGDPQNPETPTTTIHVNARSVVVDVVVTDKSNHAITSLSKDDFQIFEDGKPQTVTYFERHTTAQQDSATAEAPSQPLPPNTFTNVPPHPASDAVNVILMDALNTPNGDQIYVRKQMISYLAAVPPGARIAIFLLGNRLRIVQGFTDDSSVLREAIARHAANPQNPALLANAGETTIQQTAVGQIASSGEPGRPSATSAAAASALQQFFAEQKTFQNNERVITFIEAMRQIALYLAGVPGRKNLIWFAGSIPQCFFAQDAIDCPYFEQMKKTLTLLADAQIALYPVDAGGLQPDSISDASPPPITASLSSMTGPNGSVMDQAQAATKLQTSTLESGARSRNYNHLAMDEIAEQTGGKAYYNQNEIQSAIRDDIDNGSRYYTLAYTPTNLRTEGRKRKIEVRIMSGKYTLAYRRSYLEDTAEEAKKSDAAPVKDPLRPLMDRGMLNFTQLQYRLEVVPSANQPAPNATPAGDNAALKAPFTRYGIDFYLQPEGLNLVTAENGTRRGKVELALVAYNQAGKPLNWEVRIFGIAIAPEQFALAQTSGIPLHLDFDAPPGDVYLRSGIYDPSSSHAGTLEIPLSAVKAPPPATQN